MSQFGSTNQCQQKSRSDRQNKLYEWPYFQVLKRCCSESQICKIYEKLIPKFFLFVCKRSTNGLKMFQIFKKKIEKIEKFLTFRNFIFTFLNFQKVEKILQFFICKIILHCSRFIDFSIEIENWRFVFLKCFLYHPLPPRVTLISNFWIFLLPPSKIVPSKVVHSSSHFWFSDQK